MRLLSFVPGINPQTGIVGNPNSMPQATSTMFDMSMFDDPSFRNVLKVNTFSLLLNILKKASIFTPTKPW